MKKLLSKTEKAFTLVELLVAISIFSFTLVVGIGALYSSQNFSIKAQESQVVLDGINFTMEVISREARHGNSFYCDTNPTVPSTDKTSSQNDCKDLNTPGKVLYFRPNGKIEGVAYYLDGGVIKKIDFSSGSLIPEDVTSSDIDITAFNFYVRGSKRVVDSDYDQPMVTIIMSGQTKPTSTNPRPTKFWVQDTVTQRTLDNG